MSQSQIEQFYGRAVNDQAILQKLLLGIQTPDEFIDKAVSIGTETGFSFTRAETESWIKSQIEAKANGELSDLQLEAVAGGKGENTTYAQSSFSESKKSFETGGVTGATMGILYGALGVETAVLGDDVTNWFLSW
ncbi:putative Nif11 domain-containing protein [Gammaproteobacteria bacterium]